MERRDKEQVKNAILDAVIDCKYKAQGGDVQVTQAAARAGVSTRTLNRYFPDKDEMIYLAAIRFLNRRYAEMGLIYNGKDLGGKNGMERIDAMLQMQADYYRANPAEATMMDSARLMYTLGSLKESYPKAQVGLDFRNLFLDNMALGQRDGSIRRELNARNTWVMVTATFNGLLHRLAYLNATKSEMIGWETFFMIFGDFKAMIGQYLHP